MKRSLWLSLSLVGFALAVAGCGHLDIAREGDPNHTVTGTVTVPMDLVPPPDAMLVVRLVQPADVTAAPTIAGGDLVIGQRGVRAESERVVGEQVLRAPTMPAAYRIEYRATDAELRRGFNVEARLSWGGRVRFRSIESQVVTLANVRQPVAVMLQPVR